MATVIRLAVAPAIFFLESSFLFFNPFSVSLVLLVFVDEISSGDDFQATEDDHGEGFIWMEMCPRSAVGEWVMVQGEVR